MIVGGITKTQNDMKYSIGKNIFSYIVPANKETYKNYDILFKKSSNPASVSHFITNPSSVKRNIQYTVVAIRGVTRWASGTQFLGRRTTMGR